MLSFSNTVVLLQKKLENNEYKSITEFADDARLVFTNCYKYNGTETAIVPMAKKLEGAFESHFAQILSGETTAMGDSGVSYNGAFT